MTQPQRLAIKLTWLINDQRYHGTKINFSLRNKFWNINSFQHFITVDKLMHLKYQFLNLVTIFVMVHGTRLREKVQGYRCNKNKSTMLAQRLLCNIRLYASWSSQNFAQVMLLGYQRRGHGHGEHWAATDYNFAPLYWPLAVMSLSDYSVTLLIWYRRKTGLKLGKFWQISHKA